MTFLKAGLGAFKIFLFVGIVFLLFGLAGISAWPAFVPSVEHYVGLFLFAMMLWLFAYY